MPDPDEEEMSVALNPVNADKNRNTTFLPCAPSKYTLHVYVTSCSVY